MAELVRAGLFVRGFPPENGDHIGLEIDGELAEFGVYRVRGEFHCEEVREANPRRLRHSENELTMHTLVRTRFYECVAKDLGITGQVIELGQGIWELGRKRLPGRDSSKVIFVEAGVPAAALELTLMRDPFMALCLLHHGKSPMHDWHSDKTLVRGVIEVRDGRYASDVFEDLSASLKSNLEFASHSPNEIPKPNQSHPVLRSEAYTKIFHKKMNDNFLTLAVPDYIEWKSIVIRGLITRRNHFQAFLLGAINMAKLVDARIFDSADPLDDLPDLIWLDIDGGEESYEIIQAGDKIHCYKISIPSRCETFQSEETGYEFTVKDFSPHKLVRENFYAEMAGDLGITVQVCRLGDGLWELGRKSIAGQGRVRVIFVEQGVEQNDIIACLALHGFKTNCLLFHGKPPGQVSVPERNVVSSPVLVEDGRFFSEFTEDLVASRPDSIPETGVDLDSTPQKLVICGEVKKQKGHLFEARGKKRAKFNNESYDLTTWRCYIDERNFDLPDVIGSELLVRILCGRGEPIYADALLRSLSGEATDVADDDAVEWLGKEESQAGTKRFTIDARDEILTSEQITLLQNQVRAIVREIVKCGDDPGLVSEKNSLIELREQWGEYLMAATKPGPNGTLLPKSFDDALKKAGNLVGKHIREVVNRLKDIDEALWSHLSNKNILKHGQVCQYDAEIGYKWRKKNQKISKRNAEFLK